VCPGGENKLLWNPLEPVRGHPEISEGRTLFDTRLHTATGFPGPDPDRKFPERDLLYAFPPARSMERTDLSVPDTWNEESEVQTRDPADLHVSYSPHGCRTSRDHTGSRIASDLLQALGPGKFSPINTTLNHEIGRLVGERDIPTNELASPAQEAAWRFKATDFALALVQKF
jgi:hypothetical protein